jgi:hypothetical protein
VSEDAEMGRGGDAEKKRGGERCDGERCDGDGVIPVLQSHGHDLYRSDLYRGIPGGLAICCVDELREGGILTMGRV